LNGHWHRSALKPTRSLTHFARRRGVSTQKATIWKFMWCWNKDILCDRILCFIQQIDWEQVREPLGLLCPLKCKLKTSVECFWLCSESISITTQCLFYIIPCRATALLYPNVHYVFKYPCI
jgi:hypothetical protein